MLRWQRDCIDRNLPKLLEFTRCNISLLTVLSAKNIISEAERESLGDVHIECQNRASELYRILKTRTNAFSVLKDALKETNQSGAYEVLNESYTSNEDYQKYKKLSYEEDQVVYINCNTTRIHKGKFGNRDVLVKVLSNVTTSSLREAKNELDYLTALDWNECIVRCFIAKFITKGYSKYFAVALDYQTNLMDFRGNVRWIANDLMSHVFMGVKFLHSQRIIHADLKPKSILVSCPTQASTRAKVGEFGLSHKLLDGESSVSISMKTLEEKGDGCFYTPEVLCLAQDIECEDEMASVDCTLTLQTDVFCLGAILYFILSGGKHPFGCLLDRRRNVNNNQLKINQDLFDSLSLHSKESILNMLEATPSNRPALDSLINKFYKHSL